MTTVKTHWILSVAPAWVPDEDAAQCFCCEAQFSFFKRKHHCRNCGSVVCDSCSQRRVSLPQYGITDLVRVCLTCFPGPTLISAEEFAADTEAKAPSASMSMSPAPSCPPAALDSHQL